MAKTKVLVVDDSLTMRALISGALERIPQVEVVGVADGADEARSMVMQYNPDVMTLDIEMPGMSGLEYLAEIMEKRPMPVIMFSTRTEAGAEASVEALRLGAIDCFPKPKVALQSEFEAILGKLGKRIKAAKGAKPRATGAPKPVAASAPFDWNGHLVTMGGDAANTQLLFDVFGAFPANCPPTLVVQHLGNGLAETLVRKLDETVAPRVVLAQDGMAVEQGTIYFAPPGDAHLVVDSWPGGKLRLLPRDPVSGERPSISLLFASAAKAAGNAAIGVLLAPGGEDGATGLKALMSAGGYGIAPADLEGSGFTLTRNMAQQPVATEAVAPTIVKLAGK